MKLAGGGGSEITLDEFALMFRGAGIRAWLNWDEVFRRRYDVTETYSASRDLLGRLHTVWYVTPDGRPGDWRAADDRPVGVSEAAATGWPADRLARIARFEAMFGQERQPVQLVLPALRIGSRCLLLDGTHRAVAAHRSPADIRIFLFTLHGPLSAEILPDLAHYRDD